MSSRNCDRCEGPLPAGRLAYCEPCAEAKRSARGAPAGGDEWMLNGLITLKRYDAMFLKQDGKCRICQQTQPKRLAVDHDHATGKVRGLLCDRCNLGIGHFRDDPWLLREAARYLGRKR